MTKLLIALATTVALVGPALAGGAQAEPIEMTCAQIGRGPIYGTPWNIIHIRDAANKVTITTDKGQFEFSATREAGSPITFFDQVRQIRYYPRGVRMNGHPWGNAIYDTGKDGPV
jgi:hypothetical protein